MLCPKCGSNNVNVQVINEVYLKNKHQGCLWWLFIGCWWVPFKWLVLTVPAIILKIFGRKKQKVINKNRSTAVCQNCGYRWNG